MKAKWRLPDSVSSVIFFKSYTDLEVLDEVLNDSDSGEENLYSGEED